MSVVNQTYKNIQIIIADDASTDNSRVVIEDLKVKHPHLEILLFNRNEGNCKAFNKAFKHAKGDFIIDFAADDVMMPNRIERQVHLFQSLDDSYGVVFTDAEYIDGEGTFLRRHYEHLFKKRLLKQIPVGNVYRDVLSRYFIASPTMMVKREVLEELNGYDESLSYEDFDFWVRSSRHWNYGLLNESLTKIRRTGKSMSAGWYTPGDKQLHSTYLVCRKAMLLSRDEGDKQALQKRVRYELRQSVFSGNNNEATMFYGLLTELNSVTLSDRILNLLNKLKLPLSGIRLLYHTFRFR